MRASKWLVPLDRAHRRRANTPTVTRPMDKVRVRPTTSDLNPMIPFPPQRIYHILQMDD